MICGKPADHANPSRSLPLTQGLPETHEPYALGTNEITENHFTTEAEALAEVAAMGWHPFARNVVIAADEKLHLHDFEAVTFIISGTLRIVDEKIITQEFKARTRFRTGAGPLHRELGRGTYRVVQGFRVDPKYFTRPLNKPPPLLDERQK